MPMTPKQYEDLKFLVMQASGGWGPTPPGELVPQVWDYVVEEVAMALGKYARNSYSNAARECVDLVRAMKGRPE